MSDTKTLITKLTSPGRSALEQAAALCVSLTNFTVEIEHFLLKLNETLESDWSLILKTFDINSLKLQEQLQETLEKFKRGNTRTPAFSPHILKLLEEAWVITSLTLEAAQIRTGALLLALLESESLRGILVESCPLLLMIPRLTLREEFLSILQLSPEAHSIFSPSHSSSSASFKEDALNRFTHDLTKAAKTEKIDPVTGRDLEIRQMIDILMRRRQNNPILTGEAGVGKTAIVEGLALKISTGDVPPPLQNVTVRALDLGLLEAGAGLKGEFEERLKSVISEVQNSPTPIILFIDEAHTLIGSGSAPGQGDAANLLKPALARGELRIIAATTWAEYKKYFEKDAALSRRFQVIKVEEPDEATAIKMLRGLIKKLEDHHHVRIEDQAVQAAVHLSHRYLTGRKLPDKAVSVLDTACARVSVAQNSIPESIEFLTQEELALQTHKTILLKEQNLGLDCNSSIEELDSRIKEITHQRIILETQWKEELPLIKEIRSLEREIESPLPPQELKLKKEKRLTLETELKNIHNRYTVSNVQSGSLIPISVDEEVIAHVISSWTGIPLGKMVRDEIETVLSLKPSLEKRIIGQPTALDSIARRLQTYRAHLDEPLKPVGVFLLVGPSGVGKTETALALADILYGGEKSLISLNMSEYQEAYTISSLKGSPPGYVGFGQGGVLTEAVRRNPHSIVLLDEIEKAHGDVVELFYQVFDKGVLEDSEGMEVDFKNTVILITSNIGSDQILDLYLNKGGNVTPQEIEELIRPDLIKHFKPAFIGRLVIVPYMPLSMSQIQEIIKLKLTKIQERFFKTQKATLTYENELLTTLAQKCEHMDSGARAIDTVLTQNLLPGLSLEILERMMQDRPFLKVHISTSPENPDQFLYKFE